MTRSPRLNIVFVGLSITSSWGNGHATTYRALLSALARRGHRVTFLERDTPWYAVNRDIDSADYCAIALYPTFPDLKRDHAALIREADLVVVGSYVTEGIPVGRWVIATARGVTAFYDIDTPVTIANLARQKCSYLDADLIARFDVYLSFTGGPFLTQIQKRYHIREVYPLYCSADPSLYYPTGAAPGYDLGYMGTYSADRQPPLERMLIQAAIKWPAGRFLVAGPQYPETIFWQANIRRWDHIPPHKHRDFYNDQRFTLNVTREDMIQAGSSPSVRLFEAAACGTPIISDYWEGLESFFKPGEEILISDSPGETLHYLKDLTESERFEIGEKARRKVLAHHTPDDRAEELERVFLAMHASNRTGALTSGRKHGRSVPAF